MVHIILNMKFITILVVDAEYLAIVESHVLDGKVNETVVHLPLELENEENDFTPFLNRLLLHNLAVQAHLVQNPEKRLQYV